VRSVLRGEHYLFFFFAFFLADFLAAFFFLATVRPPLNKSLRKQLPAIFDGCSASESQTTQPTTIDDVRRSDVQVIKICRRQLPERATQLQYLP
jgi:hypothetical protein